MDSSSDYAWPSSVNVANFVTVKPSLEEEGNERSNNFKFWKEQMLCLLESQDVLGFVDGEILPPPENDRKKQWRRTDRLVKGWILGSIEKDVLDLVWEKPTAMDVWTELDNIFNKIEEGEGEGEGGEIEEEGGGGGETIEDPLRNIYLALYEAAQRDDWDTAHKLFQDNNLDLATVIDGNSGETALHVAVKTGSSNHFVKKMVEQMPPEALALTDSNGSTALHLAVMVKNEEAIIPMIEKNPDLLQPPPGETREDLSYIYLSIYKAAQRGDWDTAHKLFRDNNVDLATAISRGSETVLHVAVQTGNANHFVKKLVDVMPQEALALTDHDGKTALQVASIVGNIEAAITMIDKYPDLLQPADDAVLQAAEQCHKEMLQYLISKSKPYMFEMLFGFHLLKAIIASEFYDVALDIVYKYPSLARFAEKGTSKSALLVLSETTSGFLSGESFSWWQKLLYYCIPVRMTKEEPANPTDVHVAADIENTTGCDAHAYRCYYTLFQINSGGKVVKQKLESAVWKIIQVTVPSVWEIRKKKAVHQQALQLANYLCEQIITLPGMAASSMVYDSMMNAAKNGISEIVEMIMEMYPEITFTVVGATRGSIFHLAASQRFENVFSLIYSLTGRTQIIYDLTDNEGNNLMHICGKLAPPDRLNLVPGAALQMQRELQWFKEMENFVRPSRRTLTNNKGDTPKKIFTNEHKQLKEDGERWMKDTANACTIAAALIATVMFTAAFTLPGGLVGDTGVPIFVEQPAFILFAISDAVSMFTSITSLLMFLSILTSRYAEEDFLYVLPMRLSIGLFTLFVSITFMLVAFSATMYLVFRGRVSWFLIPAAALTCLPIASFVLLQFPLLVDVVYSTYGPGIFVKKTNRVFY